MFDKEKIIREILCYSTIQNYCADNNCRYAAIYGFPDYYVTSDGNIWSNKSHKLLIPTPNSTGYLTVSLQANGKQFTKKLHRLVAEAFVPNDDPAHKTTVDHIDGDKTNNRADNLQWLSRAANIRKNQYRPLVLWNISEHAAYGFIGRDAALNYLYCSKRKLLEMIVTPNLMCRGCVVAAAMTKDKEWQFIARDIPSYILEQIKAEMRKLDKQLLCGGLINE